MPRSILSAVGSLQSFSRAFSSTGFFSSAWFYLERFSPQFSSQRFFFLHVVLLGMVLPQCTHSVVPQRVFPCFVVLQAVFTVWHKGQVCMAEPVAPTRQVPAARSRGKSMPCSHGSIFVSWPRLHLRLAAKAPSSFRCRPHLHSVAGPFSFRCGSIFIQLPRLHLRSVLLPRLHLHFSDRGSIFTLTTVAGDGFEAD